MEKTGDRIERLRGAVKDGQAISHQDALFLLDLFDRKQEQLKKLRFARQMHVRQIKSLEGDRDHYKLLFMRDNERVASLERQLNGGEVSNLQAVLHANAF